MRRSARFIDVAGRRLFVLQSDPDGPSKGVVIHVPAFAEEMNKSRRMVTLATQALVADGWSVLVFDLSGCGDSSGVFEDADWAVWIEDLDHVVAWSRQQAETADAVVLWALRGGALIASDWLARSGRSVRACVLWQPVLSGKLQVTQFLRLRAASEMLGVTDASSSMTVLRASLREGKSVDVAGYRLNPQLVEGMENSAVEFLRGACPEVAMIEIGTGESASPSPAMQVALDKWSAAGLMVDHRRIAGPAFWNTQYIETAPELVSATSSILRSYLP